MYDQNEWVNICSVSGMTTAKIITGRLESENIPARLSYEAAGPIYAITVDGLGEVRILVPAPEQERARAILSQNYEEWELDWEKGMPEPPREGDGE
ncbi:MAG: DUF2007 domain-containing protein [Syntrophales bacterium]